MAESDVERGRKTFSRTKKVPSDHRISMLPVNLEEALFFFINKGFWDIDVISKIVEQEQKVIEIIFL